MKTLEDNLKEVILQKDDKSSDIERLSKASSDYKKMVDAGLTVRRGYNLMTICDVPKVKYQINH